VIRSTIIIGVLLLWSCFMWANDFADIQSAFDDFSRDSQLSFKQFADSNDQQYTQWLAEQWLEYEQFSALVRDPVPKPGAAPVVVVKVADKTQAVPDEPIKPIERGFPASNSTEASTVFKAAEIKEKQVAIPQNAKLADNGNSYQFYGVAWALPSMGIALNTIRSEADVAVAWNVLSLADYQIVVTAIKQQQADNHLSDWGLLQLLHQLAEQRFEHHNQRQVYVWFFMTKLGYQLHAGFDAKQLVLLFGSQQTVYEKPYYQLSGQKFYLLNPVTGKLRLPKQRYPGTVQALDLRFGGTLYGVSDIQQRVIEVDGQTFTITTRKPRTLFLESYPQLDLQHYFSASLAPVTAASLRQQLLPVLEGKTPLEQVDWLLRWMQFGFQYQVDKNQFGQENYFHPEENFVFAANDCEDRSFILSWLVGELLGLSVIGLNYPGHVAIAVAFPEGYQPELPATLEYAGQPYWIADPTYIGAAAGQVMPQYRSQKPEVITY
jgi:hypothetical protein